MAVADSNVGECLPGSIGAVASRFKILGHPMRLKLLCLIHRGQDSCVGELHACLHQPQPVVSQHLAVLKDGGIVASEIKGNRRIYSIVDPFVLAMLDALADLPDSPCKHA